MEEELNTELDNTQTTGIETQEPNPEGQATEENPLVATVKSKFPDREFASDADVMNAANELILDYDQKIERQKTSNAKVMEAIKSDPAFEAILVDMMRNKTSFAVALHKHADMDALMPQEGEPDYDAYNATVAEKRKKMEEDKAWEEQRNRNLEASMQEIQALADELKISDEEAETFINDFTGLFTRVLEGNIDKETFRKLYRAINYDKLMAEETAMAETRGRNAKVEEMASEEMMMNDGTAGVGSGGGDVATEEPSEPEDDPFLNSIDKYLKRQK